MLAGSPAALSSSADSSVELVKTSTPDSKKAETNQANRRRPDRSPFSHDRGGQ